MLRNFQINIQKVDSIGISLFLCFFLMIGFILDILFSDLYDDAYDEMANIFFANSVSCL